ncbi:LysR substrate-binding domain-containing protein [Shigella flexneri]
MIEGPCHSTEIISEPWLEDELWCSPHRRHRLQGTRHAGTTGCFAVDLRERGSGTRELVDYLLLSHLPRFQMAMESGNSEAIKHAVRHGLGISCLSRRSLPSSYRRNAERSSCAASTLVRTMWRVHHRQKHISNAITRFLHYSDRRDGGIAVRSF